jgi:pSer/pThr/pTyr-binding forkhead associated (FHA) protein
LDCCILKKQQRKVMASLVVQQKGKEPSVYQLNRHTTIIGRGRDAGLLLPDISVSRHHAQIINTEEGFLLVDLKSQNGTVLNGKQVTKKLLTTGDAIGVGKYNLVFRQDQKLKNAESLGDSIDSYAVTGRQNYLQQVTELSGDKAHSTAHVSKTSMVALRKNIQLKERGTIVSLADPSKQWKPLDRSLEFGSHGIPANGMRGGKAKIVWTGKGHGIKKLSGMFLKVLVNGRPTKGAMLSDGDSITVGTSSFKYIFSADEP